VQEKVKAVVIEQAKKDPKAAMALGKEMLKGAMKNSK